MADTSTSAFLALVAGRRGHFRLESGHHGGLWLDLDGLFSNTSRIAPFVDALTAALATYRPEIICGPLLGGAFLAQLVAQKSGVDFCFTERRKAADDTGLFQTKYSLPRAFHDTVRDKRVAMVDDVMSAGSALRGTFNELRSCGAHPVAAGALLMLGTAGSDYFAEHAVPVEAVARDVYELWTPERCPLCERSVPLENPS